MRDKYTMLKWLIETEFEGAKDDYEKEKGVNERRDMFNQGIMYAYECMMSKIECLEKEG